MKDLCFLGTPFSKNKLLTFGIFNESNIWAKVYHILKIEVCESIIVEITGIRSCYFSSLNIVQINLITRTQKQRENQQYSILKAFLKKMSAKSSKKIKKSPSTIKQQLCKVFAKLNGNHLLMANIFKLHKYNTFGLMKMHNICKMRFRNNIFSL